MQNKVEKDYLCADAGTYAKKPKEILKNLSYVDKALEQTLVDFM